MQDMVTQKAFQLWLEVGVQTVKWNPNMLSPQKFNSARVQCPNIHIYSDPYKLPDHLALGHIYNQIEFAQSFSPTEL